MAKDEAERVEAEETGGEPAEPTGEAETAPEPDAEDVTDVGGEIDTKALEGVLGRHEKALRKVLGEGFEDMQPCQTCEGFGFVPQGFEPVPELKASPMYERCGDCNGYGQVLTGAMPDASPLAPCTSCAGGGYITKPADAPPPAYAQAAPGNGADHAALAPVAQQVDPTAIEALRRAGFTVIEPYTQTAPAA